MIKTIRNAWKIPDLRRKMIFTLLVIVIFRIGSMIPVPFLDAQALQSLMESESGPSTFFGFIESISGGAFGKATLFAMSVTPYINASIIMQLLTVAIPPLERLQKEGEEGRKKLSALTRYVTVILGLIQGFALYLFLKTNSGVVQYTEGASGIFVAIVIILAFTAGTALMMWLGEQVNKKGVGNGISILLFAGIVARMPSLVSRMVSLIQEAIEDPEDSARFFLIVPSFLIIVLAVIWIIVFMNEAERRIPIQYAKRVVGRKMYGGQNSHIPIKVGLAGVMPIIFASSILQVPNMIKQFFHIDEGFWGSFLNVFRTDGWVYPTLYFVLILAFAYFYVSIQYNPIEMANNLRQSNGTIPGIRPGKPTSDFIKKVLSKVTLMGASFLAVIAILPFLLALVPDMRAFQLQGTSIIILVGVALETVKQLESQMMMRHYKGFLD